MRAAPRDRAARRVVRAVLVGAAVVGVVGLVACAALQWQPQGPRRIAEVVGAERTGAEECLVCHPKLRGHTGIPRYHADCEACHGMGSLHVSSEALADIRFPGTVDCLACHSVGRDTHLQWGAGEHARAGLICTDCHDSHAWGSEDAKARNDLRDHAQTGFREMNLESRLCLDCHRDVASKLTWPSHHPVGEGAMGCIDCHDPHADIRIAKGERTRVCAGCHQDVMGPWIYEHPPAVEDCSICHDPHGAATANLLETIQPIVCITCHTVNDTFHSKTTQGSATFLRRCTDCHGAVHGSQTDEHLRH